MKVKMITRSAGPGGTINPGEIADMPEDQAMDAIARGFAVSAEPPKKDPPKEDPKKPDAETATQPDGEAATAPTGETATTPTGETAEGRQPRRRGRRGS